MCYYVVLDQGQQLQYSKSARQVTLYLVSVHTIIFGSYLVGIQLDGNLLNNTIGLLYKSKLKKIGSTSIVEALKLIVDERKFTKIQRMSCYSGYFKFINLSVFFLSLESSVIVHSTTELAHCFYMIFRANN